MFESIIDDIKQAFRSGNTLTRIILVNVALFVLINLIGVFSGGFQGDFFTAVKNGLSIPGSPITFLKQPWSLITHMFLHVGFFHIFFNMLLLYWFGRIVGDFLGDKRFLSLYLLGGLTGALFYMLSASLLPGSSMIGSYALGASAAVMAFVFTAAALSPDYSMNLILLGPVKIKYIALVLLFMDIVGTVGNNSGGAIAHIGGALFGMSYVYFLRQGTDLTNPLQQFFGFFKKEYPSEPKRSEYIKVVHKDLSKPKSKSNHKQRYIYDQKKIDAILDKINDHGYDSLSKEEKEILYNASKK